MNQRKEAEMDKVHQGTSSLRPCHFPLGKPQVYWNFANLHKCFVCVCVCVCVCVFSRSVRSDFLRPCRL